MFTYIDTSALRSRCLLDVATIYTSTIPTKNASTTTPTVHCKTGTGGRVDPVSPPGQASYWDDDWDD